MDPSSNSTNNSNDANLGQAQNQQANGFGPQPAGRDNSYSQAQPASSPTSVTNGPSYGNPGVVNPMNQNRPNPSPNPRPNTSPAMNGGNINSSSSSNKKILAIVLGVVGVLIIILIGLFFFMKSGKTSAETLKNFSNATSNLNSKSNSLESSISGNADDASGTDSALSEFNNALGSFDDATSKLKSDRKDLKTAAENYSSALKSFRDGDISAAIDMVDIEAIVKKATDAEDESFGSSSTTADTAAFSTKVDSLVVVINSSKTELEGLSLRTDKGKQLRDAYVQVFSKMPDILNRLKAAVNAGDRSAANNIANEIQDLDSEAGVTDKEEQISDGVSYSSDGVKKIDDAKDKLNEQIRAVNAGQ